MKKGSTKVSDSRGESEKTTDKVKRVYRVALDTIKRVDEILKQKKAYRDVFLPEAVMLRSRLQDYCERIMFYDPLEYGKKAEELLWRKVYYDVIQLMKHNRKQMRPSSSLETAFRTHLSAAMGYYHHLMFKLQHDFCLRLDSTVDFFCVSEPRFYKKAGPSKKTIDHRIQDWATKACHRCLVCLGDLARYQQDYDEGRSTAVAERYYWQAVALCPDIGMPHNQLGTLSGSRHYNVDAAYHYLRCLVSVVSFEGAHDNLRRLFEKNKKKYQELAASSPRDLPPDHQRSKDVKRFLVRFMHFLEVFLVTWQSKDASELQEICQAALQDFNLCMFHQPQHVTNPHEATSDLHDNRHNSLDNEVVFKVSVICMMVVYLMQKEGNKQVTAVVAFSLALFSHILNHVMIRLQGALYELENPRKPLKVDMEEQNTPVSNSPSVRMMNGEFDNLVEPSKSPASNGSQEIFDTRSQEDEKIEKRRQRLRRLMKRRRRRRGSIDSSDSDRNVMSDPDSDLSEGEDHVDISESDSDEDVAHYLNESESSESDSEDNLMVSQELRPGFSLGGGQDRNEDGSQRMNGYQGKDVLLNPLNSHLTQNLNNLNQQSLEGSTLNEYFQHFSADSLSDSSSFLRFGLPFSNNKETDADYDVYKDVVQGKRDVRVPPGFEKASEAQHVKEITEKLANFVIETDTDTSNFPTDTDNSSVPTESEIENDADSVIDKAELEARRMEHLIQVVNREGLLATIKVFCDWMRCHQQIIATCAQSSQSLWSRLSVLLNLLPAENDLANEEYCREPEVLEIVQSCCSQDNSPLKAPPLQEDWHLQHFLPLNDVYKTLEFTSLNRHKLDKQQQAVVRVCSLHKFGYFLSSMREINFMFDSEKGMFYSPLDNQQNQEVQEAQKKMADTEARRNQLMRDMAQLRLQAEVNQLEGSLQASQQLSLPPYLVPDATTLCHALHQLRQLVVSSRFIIIIPLAVIDHLDHLKKESPGAREAIRWLEGEFHRGNRYIRAQKHHEKASTAPQRNLKKKDIEAWRFFQTVDCCKYLCQQTASNASGMVAILTQRTGKMMPASARVQQAVAAAEQEGIVVHNIQEFYNKWKERCSNSNTG